MGLLAKILTLIGMANGAPDRAEILSEALTCGLQESQLKFFVDDEGALNVDVFRLKEDGDEYLDKVECFMIWAAEKRVPLGVSNKVEEN